jgi:hypothetical protein
MDRRKNGKKLIQGLSGLSLLIATVVGMPGNATIAESKIQYRPPQRQPVGRRNVRAAGHRGSCQESGTMPRLELLVPENHIGMSLTANPTFFWKVEGSSVLPLAFTLVEPGVASPIFEQKFSSTNSGLYQVTLPAKIQLKENQTYRWTVAMICNPFRPSQNVYAQALLVRPELTSNLKLLAKNRPLASQRNHQIALLARWGFWYDALALSFETEAFDQLREQMGHN